MNKYLLPVISLCLAGLITSEVPSTSKECDWGLGRQIPLTVQWAKDTEPITISKNDLVLVVHAHDYFKAHKTIKEIDLYAGNALNDPRITPIFISASLTPPSTRDSWLCRVRNPKIFILSSRGHHKISMNFKKGSATILGGIFNECLKTALEDIIKNGTPGRYRTMVIKLPTKGIYVPHDKRYFCGMEVKATLNDVCLFSAPRGILGNLIKKYLQDINLSHKKYIYWIRIYYKNKVIGYFGKLSTPGNPKKLVHVKLYLT